MAGHSLKKLLHDAVSRASHFPTLNVFLMVETWPGKNTRMGERGEGAERGEGGETSAMGLERNATLFRGSPSSSSLGEEKKREKKRF